MDYRTFSESYSHSRRSVEHIANLMRNRVDEAPSFALFLGAGASVTSGVRAASSMLEQWRRCSYASANTDQHYESWLVEQDWYEAEDEYSQLFELTYDQPSQRRAFIENAVEASSPSWGYAYLTSLIEARVVNAIFTTNFDDLVNEACFQFGRDLRPLVCAHDSAVNSIRLMSERPKVIKLHGDFLYDNIKNTTSELTSLEQNMRDKLAEFSRELGLIVVGYSGSDKSVMDVMTTLVRSPASFRHGVYWCVRRGGMPGARLRQFLRHERVYWAEIDGFDEFMADLANGMRVPLPFGVIAPHEAIVVRNQHLFDESHSTTHPRILQAKSECSESYRKLCGILRANGLHATDAGQGRKSSTIADDLAEMTAPWLQACVAVDERSYEKAESILAGLQVKVSKHRQWQWRVYVKLLDCWLDMGGKNDEIRTALLQAVPDHGDSDELARCAYYALFLNDAELALRFATSAIDLNPGSPLALVNMGLARLQLGAASEVARISETLVAKRMQERFRAAGFAMIGDLESMIAPLQRAMALSDYSPQYALQDVAFRPYWNNERFLSALRPFAKSAATVLESPRSVLYPMTEAERALMDGFRCEDEQPQGDDRKSRRPHPSVGGSTVPSA